jgi:sugar lactone lactonase YvrE
MLFMNKALARVRPGQNFMKKFRFQVLMCVVAGASLPAQTVFNPVPTRIFGQSVLQQQGVLTAIAPNLVEGREFDAPQALAIDSSVSPPILYVADTINNRVLAWKNAAAFMTGAVKADKVIGQRDFLTTAPKGPGTDLSSGLSQPTALLVDSKGNLYVADSGNNRIVRYPAPFKQTSALLSIDLILGQTDSNGNSSNQGQPTPAANTLAFTGGGGIFLAGLAFDGSGNLWVSDAANNRVLRYPAPALASGAANDPSADMILGQSSFVTNALPTGQAFSRTGKSFIDAPAGLRFDPEGRLFVTDLLNRVLVYLPPFVLGQSASRIMGVVPATQSMPNPPAVSASTLGAISSQGLPVPPEGVFFVGNNPFIVDTGNNRILEYTSFDQWPAESTAFSPAATAVIGQTDFVSRKPNRGQARSSALGLSSPVGATFFNNEMYVADAGNNRVLVIPQQSGGFSSATRLLGQTDFIYNSINLIEL